MEESSFVMTPFRKSSIPSLTKVHDEVNKVGFFSYFAFNLSLYLNGLKNSQIFKELTLLKQASRSLFHF